MAQPKKTPQKTEDKTVKPETQQARLIQSNQEVSVKFSNDQFKKLISVMAKIADKIPTPPPPPPPAPPAPGQAFLQDSKRLTKALGIAENSPLQNSGSRISDDLKAILLPKKP